MYIVYMSEREIGRGRIVYKWENKISLFVAVCSRVRGLYCCMKRRKSMEPDPIRTS